MLRKSMAVIALLLAGCSSAGLPAPSAGLPAPSAAKPEPAPAVEVAPPAPDGAPRPGQPGEASQPAPLLHPQIKAYGPVQRAEFSFEEQQRISEAVGEGYARYPEPAMLMMPDRSAHRETNTAVVQLVQQAQAKPFTVTYQLQGDFQVGRHETGMFWALGSGQVTVHPNGDSYINTDRLQLVRQGGQVWRRKTDGSWEGPFKPENVAGDLKATAAAQLTPDQLGLLDVARWSGQGGGIARPDGTEEWYAGGQKLTTISIFGSGWFSCYYYKLTVNKEGDRYHPIAVDVRFWDAANLGLHAEWNVDTPAAFPELPSAVSGQNPAPAKAKVSLLTVADLKAGKHEPRHSWSVAGPVAGFRLAPDGRTALLYPTPFAPGLGPLLLDLPTGKQTPLAVPRGRDDAYSAGGWLPDGRIYLVGAGQLWVGAPDAMKPLGEAFAWVVEPSPSGRYLALWGPNQAGEVQVADLQQGTLRKLPGPFRRGAQDGSIALGWSPDEQALAGTDFDGEDGRGMKVRIVNPITGEQVRTIPDAAFGAWLPGGQVLARRWAPVGDFDYRNVVVAVDGTETPFATEYCWYLTPSPNGRYLLYNAYKPLNYWVVDLQTGEQFGFVAPGFLRWTQGSDLVVVN